MDNEKFTEEINNEFEKIVSGIDQPDEVVEIEKEISQTEKSLQQHAAEINELAEAVAACRNIKSEAQSRLQEQIKALQDAFYKETQEIADRQNKAQQKLNEVTSKKEMAKSRIEELKVKKVKITSEAQAKKLLAEKMAELRDLFSDTEWAQNALPYQLEDIMLTIQAFREQRTGVINANVMGAGKTFEAAALIDVFRADFSKKFGRNPCILWTTKKSLVKQTKTELRRWNSTSRFIPMIGKGAKERDLYLETFFEAGLAQASVLMTNYETVRTTKILREYDWDLVIVDEAHHLVGWAGSQDATPNKLYLSFERLFGIDRVSVPGMSNVYNDLRVVHDKDGNEHKLPFRYLMTGTPLQNRWIETWGYMHLLNPQKFDSIARFERLFGWGGNAYIPRVMELLQGQMIRQDPELVYQYRPSKEIVMRLVEKNEEQQKVYDTIRAGVLEAVEGTTSMSAFLAILTRLRQANVYPHGIKTEFGRVKCEESAKLDEAMELIEQLTSEGEQVVVWSTFVEPLHALANRIIDAKMPFNGTGETVTCQVVTGEQVQGGMHETYAEAFRQGKIKIILSTMKSMGTGVNLHKDKSKWEGGARNAIFLDLWYNPKTNEQAEDRIWRKTENKERVNIYQIIDENSIDSLILAILEAKEQENSAIVESEDLRPIKNIIANIKDYL